MRTWESIGTEIKGSRTEWLKSKLIRKLKSAKCSSRCSTRMTNSSTPTKSSSSATTSNSLTKIAITSTTMALMTTPMAWMATNPETMTTNKTQLILHTFPMSIIRTTRESRRVRLKVRTRIFWRKDSLNMIKTKRMTIFSMWRIARCTWIIKPSKRKIMVSRARFTKITKILKDRRRLAALGSS